MTKYFTSEQSTFEHIFSQNNGVMESTLLLLWSKVKTVSSPDKVKTAGYKQSVILNCSSMVPKKTKLLTVNTSMTFCSICWNGAPLSS